MQRKFGLGRARTSLRRGIQLPVRLGSDYWDGAIPFMARDLSSRGVFIETALPLELGEEVELRFTPPGFRYPVDLRGEVRRVAFHRRAGEAGESGMGVEFKYLSRELRELLELSLRGIPPRLPKRREKRTPLAAV
ncbi:MAG: hypothetical protein GX614_14625 [Sandaracinaceae bacterium]|nr:hypothetical protein [Sandaracinaceae bacterium]